MRWEQFQTLNWFSSAVSCRRLRGKAQNLKHVSGFNGLSSIWIPKYVTFYEGLIIENQI